jgi:acetyl esterase/lipase
MRAMTLKSALLCFLSLFSAAASAQTVTPSGARPADPFLGVATYRLWEDDAPGARGTADADVPTLTMFRVHAGNGNGTAVVVAPGGAYRGLAANLEGRQVADWFAARGVTAFVLKYRLGKNYLFPTPLVDARRAIRFVRARAAEFGVASDRIGMMGFSAGGHLTATAATMSEPANAGAADPVERVSSRPDFIVLGYPWLNAMKPDQKTLAYCSALALAPSQCAGFEQFSPDQHVTKDTPPAFIYHTTDDELVPVDASVTFYRALAAAGVPAEMHLFGTGRHGSGLGLGDAALDLWPTLLEAWLRGRGLLTIDAAMAAERQRLMSPPAPRAPGAPFSVDLAIRDLVTSPAAKAILVKHLGAEYVEQIAEQGPELRLRGLALFDPDRLGAATLDAIEHDLGTVAR